MRRLAAILALSVAAASPTFAQTPEYEKTKAPVPYNNEGIWVLGRIGSSSGWGFVSTPLPRERRILVGDWVVSSMQTYRDIAGFVDYRARMPDGSALFSYTCYRDGALIHELYPLKPGESVTISLDCSDLNPIYAKPRATLDLELLELSDGARIEAVLK